MAFQDDELLRLDFEQSAPISSAQKRAATRWHKERVTLKRYHAIELPYSPSTRPIDMPILRQERNIIEILEYTPHA